MAPGILSPFVTVWLITSLMIFRDIKSFPSFPSLPSRPSTPLQKNVIHKQDRLRPRYWTGDTPMESNCDMWQKKCSLCLLPRLMSLKTFLTSWDSILGHSKPSTFRLHIQSNWVSGLKSECLIQNANVGSTTHFFVWVFGVGGHRGYFFY